LLEKFGSQFLEYIGAVPRWLPLWKSWGKGVRVPTSLRKALRTERNTLQSFSLVTLAISLHWLLA